jgi:hypothetical protein
VTDRVDGMRATAFVPAGRRLLGDQGSGPLAKPTHITRLCAHRAPDGRFSHASQVPELLKPRIWARAFWYAQHASAGVPVFTETSDHILYLDKHTDRDK